MQTTRLLLMPWLHKNLVQTNLPPAVLCLNPGLGKPDKTDETTGLYTPPRLPLNAAQAQAALNEMLELGANLSRGGELKLLAGQALTQRQNASSQDQAWKQTLDRRHEERDLERFAAGTGADNVAAGTNGGDPGVSISAVARESFAADINTATAVGIAVSSADTTATSAATSSTSPAATSEASAEQQISAQKVLLLFWNLEERLLEIKAAQAELARHNQKLRASLGENVLDGENTEKNTSDEKVSDELKTLMPFNHWQNALSAAAMFLPDDVALICAAADLPDHLAAADWQAASALPDGVAKLTTDLAPASGDDAARQRHGTVELTADLASSLTDCAWLRLPLRNLIYTQNQTERRDKKSSRPWLDREVILFRLPE